MLCFNWALTHNRSKSSDTIQYFGFAFLLLFSQSEKKNTHQQAKTASLEEKVQVNEGGKSGVSCCNDKTKPDTVANKNHCPISNDSCLSFSGG